MHPAEIDWTRVDAPRRKAAQENSKKSKDVGQRHESLWIPYVGKSSAGARKAYDAQVSLSIQTVQRFYLSCFQGVGWTFWLGLSELRPRGLAELTS